jgi:hypothetical protein
VFRLAFGSRRLTNRRRRRIGLRGLGDFVPESLNKFGDAAQQGAVRRLVTHRIDLFLQAVLVLRQVARQLGDLIAHHHGDRREHGETE